MAGNIKTTSGGLNFTYPDKGRANFSALFDVAWGRISAHDHSRDAAGRGAALTDRSLLALNEGWLQSADAAGTGTVNLIRANSSDVVELATLGTLTTTGAITTGDITLPTADGTAGQVIKTDGSGVLTFTTVSGGGGAVGQVLQAVYAETATSISGYGQINLDNSIPQNTEGAEFITATITPISATSKLVLDFSAWGGAEYTNNILTVALFRDSTAGALAANSSYIGGAKEPTPISLNHSVTSGSTSATTFKIRYGDDNGFLCYMLAGPTNPTLGGMTKGHLRILEIEV